MQVGGTLQPEAGWAITTTLPNAFRGRLFGMHMEHGKCHCIVPVMLQ